MVWGKVPGVGGMPTGGRAFGKEKAKRQNGGKSKAGGKKGEGGRGKCIILSVPVRSDPVRIRTPGLLHVCHAMPCMYVVKCYHVYGHAKTSPWGPGGW